MMIEFKNVCLQFEEKIILNDFNIKIRENEKILLQGRSGIGKTSILQLVLGFKKINSGNIFFQGEEIDSQTVWNIRRSISYVPQNIAFQPNKVETIFNNIFNLKFNKNLTEWKKELPEILNYFDLSKNDLQKNWNELSGGEKQRFSLIIAILLKRKIFFLDEVTSALDEKLKEKTITYFLQKKDITIVVISHEKGWESDSIKIFDLERMQWQY